MNRKGAKTAKPALGCEAAGFATENCFIYRNHELLVTEIFSTYKF